MEKLLELKSNLESITEIDKALDEPMAINQYQMLIIKKMEILSDLGLNNEAVFFITPYLAEKKFKSELPSDEKLYHITFLHAIKQKNKELALQLVQKRNEALKVSERYKAIIDLIEYKKVFGENYEDDIFNLVNGVIPFDVKSSYLIELLETYEKENLLEKVLTLTDKYANIDSSKKFIPYRLRAFLNLNQIENAKALALNYLSHPTYKKDAFHVLVDVYIKENDQHKLMVLETENEEYLDQQDDNFKEPVYQKLLLFYETIGNKPSISLYKQKLSKVKKSIDKQKVISKKNDDLEDKKTYLAEEYEKIEALTPKKKNGHFVFQFEALHEVLMYSHQISEKIVLREYFRLLFIKINEFVTPLEFIIYLKDSKQLMQYKKERLYDKKIIDTWLYETVCEDILKTNEEIISVPENLKFDKNILTQKPYEEDKIKLIYAFPIGNLGAFIIHFDENLADISMFYDFFRAVSAILYAKLIDELQQARLRTENLFLSKVIDSPLMPYRIMTDKMTHFNKSAQQLLSVEPHLPLELFLLDMEYHQVSTYKNMIDELLHKPNTEKEVIYLHQNKQIRERLFSILDEGELKIISAFEDLTKNQEEKDKLLEQATTDYELRILNLNALNNHMKTYIEDKASFLLIELQGDYKTIYGYEETIKFYKEFAQVTKKFFNEGMVYRYDDKQLFVYIPQNDIRTATKIIKNYLRFLSEYTPVTLIYEKFKTVISVLRYPVSTVDKDIYKIYRYLEVTLDNAKRTQNDLLFFEYHMYEEEVFEQKVIDYLNIALENKQFTLKFNQIIDMNENIVWQYESELVLSNVNIESKYLYRIAKKRNRLIDLEKYHLRLICEFLAMLEKETKKLIKLTIPISKETIFQPSFNAYFLGLFKNYELPTEFIRLKIIGQDIKESHTARINELIDAGVGIDTTNLEAALTYPFHALHLNFLNPNEKWIDYLKNLEIILNRHNIALIIRDVKSKESRDILKKNGIKYLEGSIYKTIEKEQLIQKIKEIS